MNTTRSFFLTFCISSSLICIQACSPLLQKAKTNQCLYVLWNAFFVDEHNRRLQKYFHRIFQRMIVNYFTAQFLRTLSPRRRPASKIFSAIFWGSRVVCRLINRNVSCRKWASEATELSFVPLIRSAWCPHASRHNASFHSRVILFSQSAKIHSLLLE